MSIRSILVPFSGDKKELTALNVAFSISKDFASHVSCIHISPDPKHIAYIGFGFTGATIEDVTEDLEVANKEKANEAKEQFEKHEQKNHIEDNSGKLSPLHASAKFLHHTGLYQKIMAHQGRLADLIILGRDIKNINQDHHDLMMAALFDTGKPVLFTPPKMPKRIDAVGYTIMIAWNGSKESARAVASALPFLYQARNVYVATIDEKDNKGKKSAEELSYYLKLHEIKNKVVTIKKDDEPVAESILNKADGLKADMLVMGAYTHNRVRQMVFGGVTSYILDNADIPVLMVH